MRFRVPYVNNQYSLLIRLLILCIMVRKRLYMIEPQGNLLLSFEVTETIEQFKQDEIIDKGGYAIGLAQDRV